MNILIKCKLRFRTSKSLLELTLFIVTHILCRRIEVKNSERYRAPSPQPTVFCYHTHVLSTYNFSISDIIQTSNLLKYHFNLTPCTHLLCWIICDILFIFIFYAFLWLGRMIRILISESSINCNDSSQVARGGLFEGWNYARLSTTSYITNGNYSFDTFLHCGSLETWIGSTKQHILDGNDISVESTHAIVSRAMKYIWSK